MDGIVQFYAQSTASNFFSLAHISSYECSIYYTAFDIMTTCEHVWCELWHNFLSWISKDRSCICVSLSLCAQNFYVLSKNSRHRPDNPIDCKGFWHSHALIWCALSSCLKLLLHVDRLDNWILHPDGSLCC